MATEQVTIPEPPAGAYALVGEPPSQVVLVRDDVAAEEARREEWFPGLPADARWWRVGDDSAPPLVWAAVVEPDWYVAGVVERPAVQRLYAQAEVDAAVLAGGYETVGDHQVARGSGVCVTHGERYELPHELDRLRQREGGGRC